MLKYQPKDIQHTNNTFGKTGENMIQFELFKRLLKTIEKRQRVDSQSAFDMLPDSTDENPAYFIGALQKE